MSENVWNPETIFIDLHVIGKLKIHLNVTV